jgi:transposase-like protein
MVRPKTAAQMKRLVAQWRASGEPQARFARRHGVRPWTLWYWSRKTTLARPTAPATPMFVPVQVAPAASIAIVLPDGVRLEVGSDMPPPTVAALVTALRASC